MRHIYHLLLTIPDALERMTFHELILCAAMLTLVLTVVLMISGRKLT